MEIREIQGQCLEDSTKYWPDVQPTLLYEVCCIAGEVGEFANLAKKVNRGSLEYKGPDENGPGNETWYEMAFELADIFIYLCNIAGHMGVDLEKVYEAKRAINNERFITSDTEGQPTLERVRLIVPGESSNGSETIRPSSLPGQ